VYYNGNNRVGPNAFSLTLFQALATGAGWDPVSGRESSCTDAGASGQCVVPWAGGAKGVSSVVLVSNGVSFAGRGVLSSSRCAACIERRAQIITLVFTTVGSIANYGGFGRYVLLFFTVVSWAALPCSSPFIIGFCLANGSNTYLDIAVRNVDCLVDTLIESGALEPMLATAASECLLRFAESTVAIAMS
jgi:hypothetical protein